MRLRMHSAVGFEEGPGESKQGAVARAALNL
jgi:hypothetical protein